MPKRNIPSGEINTVNRSASEAYEQERGRFLAVKKIGAAALVATSGLFMAAGVANANPGVNIEVGGATDNQSIFIDQELHQNGSVLPGEIAVPIHYPAEMGPFVGQTPTNVSNEIGVNAVKQAVHDALANNPGQPITLWGFSQGAMVTDDAAAQLRKEGIVVNVENSGDGMGAAGITNSDIAKTFSPIVRSFGIPIGEVAPVPGTVEKLDANDVWASNQAGDIGKIFNNAMNMGSHRIIGANEVPTQVFNVNGVTYEIYNGTIPLPPGAVDGPAGPVAPGEVQSPQVQPESAQLPVSPAVEAEVVDQMVDVVPQYNEPVQSIDQYVADEIVPDWSTADPLGLGY